MKPITAASARRVGVGVSHFLINVGLLSSAVVTSSLVVARQLMTDQDWRETEQGFRNASWSDVLALSYPLLFVAIVVSTAFCAFFNISGPIRRHESFLVACALAIAAGIAQLHLAHGSKIAMLLGVLAVAAGWTIRIIWQHRRVHA